MAPYALEACYNQCCLVIKFYTYHVDNYKKNSFSFTSKDIYSKKNPIYYSSRLHIYFLKNSFISYVYVDFQISKHGKYALKLCMSKFQFYYLIKRTYNSSLTF